MFLLKANRNCVASDAEWLSSDVHIFMLFFFLFQFNAHTQVYSWAENHKTNYISAKPAHYLPADREIDILRFSKSIEDNLSHAPYQACCEDVGRDIWVLEYIVILKE